jgi:hypothetical protein
MVSLREFGADGAALEFALATGFVFGRPEWLRKSGFSARITEIKVRNPRAIAIFGSGRGQWADREEGCPILYRLNV